VSLVDVIQTCAKNHTLIRTQHFIEQVLLRQNNIVPDDEGIQYLMATQIPVYIEKQEGDTFKLFYSIDKIYDLIIVISCKHLSPYRILLVTVHQRAAKRRLGKV